MDDYYAPLVYYLVYAEYKDGVLMLHEGNKVICVNELNPNFRRPLLDFIRQINLFNAYVEGTVH